MTDRVASPVLAIAALGVVFGDIGTSPLYAYRAVLAEGGSTDRSVVLGLCSLMIWALLSVVTVLYVVLLLRTDNEGEGGLLALLALLRRARLDGRRLAAVTVVGIAGASLFLGDSVVTPAISVLSAAEGLQVVSPAATRLVLPLALLVLVGVFILQRAGSGSIGRFYGPVMAVWFLVLAITGGVSLAGDPSAAGALLPTYAIGFAVQHPGSAFLCLGSVVLVVTGAEALYADLGHFGARAIRVAWFGLVLPALVLAYLGETAEVLRDPRAAGEPFYAVIPGWATVPVLVIATLATIIASEAVIAGAFTVVHQAGGLAILPYLQTRHTSEREGGQIYLPAVNWTLAAAVLGVVVGFGSSTRLAAAYGVAVSITIMITTVLFLVLLRAAGQPGWLQLVVAGLLAIVAMLASSALLKVPSGGWLTLAIGLVLFVIMTTWWSGSRRLKASASRQEERSAIDLLGELANRGTDQLRRIPGCAIFLTENRDVAPIALRVMVEEVGVLPERVILLSWHLADTPQASAHVAAVRVEDFGDRHGSVVALEVVLGYRERLDVGHVLVRAREQAPEDLSDVDPERVTYYVSDPIPRLSREKGMARWRQRLFLVVDHLQTDRVDQLRLPRTRTIVIGRQVDL